MNQPTALPKQPYFLMDGRIFNEDGVPYPTDERFETALDADYFLNFVDAEAQFGSAYIQGSL